MKKIIHARTDFDDVELRYASWLKSLIDMMQPKNGFFVLGRGTGKTNDILAERSMDICYEMPHAYFALVGDTYTNILKNVAPTLINGWERKGWVNGVNFVVDEPPPAHFKKPYKVPHTYKHTISTFLGNFFNYISMDTPSSGAGNSYQHNFGDEMKYAEKKRMDKLTPSLRGDIIMFGDSPYFLGSTFTTDYPNILMPGEYDWILDKEKSMDVQQMKYLLQISLELNEAKTDILNAMRKRNEPLVKKYQRKIQKLAVLHYRLRKDSTFFYIASSFVNVDILTLDYFKTALTSLGDVDFRTSVLSLPPEVEMGAKFYPSFENKHIYDDGIELSYYEKYSTGDDAETTSAALKYCNPNLALEMGIDFGDMMSMVVAQHKNKDLYALKNFWTLAPEGSKELCARFLNFFRDHKNKRIDLYYDRSGNQYHNVGRDWATEIKNFLEKNPDGSSTGWTVNLMSRNQSTIYQYEEFMLAKAMMAETYKELPKLHIDKYQCRQLISSMNVAKQIIKADNKGVRRLHKDKSSEKLPLLRRPMHSTNMSDALKYLICRSVWMKILKGRKTDWATPEAI